MSHILIAALDAQINTNLDFHGVGLNRPQSIEK